MADKRILLLSNGSELVGNDPTAFVRQVVRDFFGPEVQRCLFIPFAAVTRSWDDYAARVAAALTPLELEVVSIHQMNDPQEAVVNAQAVIIGGGNTFHLLRALYERDLLPAIRSRVEAGMPYLGWSAGSNVACPTICTTNDMPIVEPPSLAALGLIPFQINPHYTDAQLPGHMGETRDERLGEFIKANPGVNVVGLREGTMLRLVGTELELLGDKTARLFRHGQVPRDLSASDSLAFLLSTSTSASEQ